MKHSFKKALAPCLIGVLLMNTPLTVLATTNQEESKKNMESYKILNQVASSPSLTDNNETNEKNNQADKKNNQADEKNPALELLDTVYDYKGKRQIVEGKIKELKSNQTEDTIKFVMDLIVHLPIQNTEKYREDRVNFSDEVLKMIKDSSAINYDDALYYFTDNAINRAIDSKEFLDFYFANHLLNKINDTKSFDELYEKLYKNAGEVLKDGKIFEGIPDFSDNDEMANAPISHPDENHNLEPDADFSDLPSNKPKPTYPDFKTGVFPYPNKTGSLIPKGNVWDFNWSYIANFGSGNWENSDYNQSQNQVPIAEDGTILSTITIQYTFEKDDDSPYYYDTGIYIGEDGTISYQDARDALYQITVQGKNKFVDDKTRALGLIDGHIVLVEDKGERFPVTEFIALFDKTSVGVKALDTRSGNTLALTDLVEYDRVTSVYINEQEVMLETKPIIDNSIVLFPIEKIAKALGGTVIADNNSTTVAFQGNKVVFTDDSATVVSNGKNIDVKVKTRKTKDGVRVAQIEPMLDMFNMKIEVNAEAYQVNIVQK